MIRGTFGIKSRGPPSAQAHRGARNGTLQLTHSRVLLKREARDMLGGFFRRELAGTAGN